MTLTFGTMAWCDTPSSALSQKWPDLPLRITGWTDLQMGEAAQPRQRGDDGRHVGDLVLGQIAGLGAGVGDELLAVAVIELLGDGERLVGGPAPALAAGLLQRRQVEQARRRLPAMLDRHRRAGRV